MPGPQYPGSVGPCLGDCGSVCSHSTPCTELPRVCVRGARAALTGSRARMRPQASRQARQPMSPTTLTSAPAPPSRSRDRDLAVTSA
eukprot:422485-Rhodomonas_salina.2